MKYYLTKKEQHNRSKWTGGTTTQLGIYPAESVYLDRNFIWRVSSATCELDESDFSKLPDFDRVLMVLEGEVILSYDEKRTVKLGELEQDSFDGAWKTKSFGKITDFNLMVRKGNEGYVDVLKPQSELVEMTSNHETEKKKSAHTFYVKDGYMIISGPEIAGQVMVNAGDFFAIEADEGEEIRYSIMGDGTVIRCQIFYDVHEEELGPEIIPKERLSLSDFKEAFILANTQFRGAKYVFKGLQKVWYDEFLSKRIAFLEKTFITMLVFIAVAAWLIWHELSTGCTDGETILALLAWLAIDIVIVSPLIYLIAMPKPIKKHIKDIDKLTPYEVKKREEELATNERVDKLLKKYQNSGRNPGA